ncbi:hypothetical protein CDAR_218651 [Caerostris darwini]|uniref:Uncharacterized protein n=1 Tax=Caerostris darwini TaxID=1538125 RepID=A0AAV4WEY2_9ARAC|nr:hypothetical protein CDAR_218651 [Caerostris darwini]
MSWQGDSGKDANQKEDKELANNVSNLIAKVEEVESPTSQVQEELKRDEESEDIWRNAKKVTRRVQERLELKYAKRTKTTPGSQNQ